MGCVGKHASYDLEKKINVTPASPSCLSLTLPIQSSGFIDSSVNILLSQSHPVIFILTAPAPVQNLFALAWTTV